MENTGDDYFGSDVQILSSNQVGAKKKESNFTPPEDVFLCQAWSGTSGDPVRSNDQSSMTFWDRVGAEYASLIKGEYVPRLGKSLPQRWNRIRTAVSKFDAIYKNINDLNPSGFTGPDKISKAVLAYNNENKPFRFLHCWTELRNSPKWNFEGATGMRTRNVVMYANQFSTPEHVSLEDDDDSPTAIPTPLERPIGQKLAKMNAKKRKAKDIDGSSSEMPGLINKSQELMRDMHVDKLGVTNKQQEVVEEMLQIKREKRDAMIMLVDPLKLTDLGRDYLTMMQIKIVNSMSENPPPST